MSTKADRGLRPRPRSGKSPQIYYVLSSEEFESRRLIQFGVEAELAGFDGVWSSDHFQPWQPNEGHGGAAWVTLSALTQRTSRVVMGTGVTCPIFRYRPAVVAQVWATLASLAPGRVFLGVGAGENLNEGAAGGGWGKYEERSSRLVEAVKVIRALWTGDPVEIDGKFWSVKAKLYDPPPSTIPIYIAAGGPKSARLAGLHGDGLVTEADALKGQPKLKAEWEKGVREADKDPRDEAIVVEHWAFVGSEKEARESAKKWRFAPKGWEPGYFDNISPAAIQRRAEAEIKLEEVTRAWTISPDPRAHIDAIQELGTLGATHVVVHVSYPDQSKVIRFYGDKVLPAFNEGSPKMGGKRG